MLLSQEGLSIAKLAKLIIGLPGSGKTHLAKSHYVPLGYTLIDDPMSIAEIHGDKIVICDPHICNPIIRRNCIDLLERLGYVVSCIYFEKDEEKCQRNISYRNDDRLVQNLKVFNYEIPDGVDTVSIWQN